ncbi:hypothetical protein PVL29_019214 [Vitis rotundifolia]|uniref:Uncharacterized protein n=1 Tax=Vitis rotundifolia TaxID=103349 RepID=A0AA38Z6X7_VITRO|nr:hypothetical protein PVL29_019214 [Vitis rotundifolia]
MEETKREEVQRVTVELKHGDDRTHTVLFAAGTALLIAWLKRAVMVCLVEQWRAWVFLALNLVLLAIVFTSARSSTAAAATSEDEETNESSDNSSSSNNNNNSNAEVVEAERKKRRRQCRRSGAAEMENEHGDCGHKTYRRRSSRVEAERVDEGVDEENRGLSKEELNERVEAFITMFRQHLVLDARRGRS